MARMDKNTARKRAHALVTQAVDDAVTEAEARSFAMKACRLIDEFDLLAPEKGALDGIVDQVVSPEMGEAITSIGDVFTRLKASGLVDAAKRAVGASRRAAGTMKGTRRRRA